MGYDDRVYGRGGGGGGANDDARPGLMTRVRDAVSGVRALIGAVLALPVVAQVVILLINYASALTGHPLNLPPLLTWDDATRLLREAWAAMAVGGY